MPGKRDLTRARDRPDAYIGPLPEVILSMGESFVPPEGEGVGGLQQFEASPISALEALGRARMEALPKILSEEAIAMLDALNRELIATAIALATLRSRESPKCAPDCPSKPQ
jgi:hypothetical protein